MQLADGKNHLLLKFNGSMHNIGAGPLELRGSNPVGGEMTVTGQRIYRQDSTFHDDTSRHPVIHFENSDGHDHWHLMNAARWSLWNQAATAQVAPAAKVGFCLEDGEAADSFAAPTPAYLATTIQRCKEGQPDATSVYEGISSGWRDVYGANVYFQWIDISDVTPGLYRLGSQMDPDNFVEESNEGNNGPALATSTVTVPGYAASPVSAAVTGAQSITLAAQQYGSPGSRRFKIVSGPSHGSLNVAAGAAFVGPGVTYSRNAGYVGSDRFTFLAFDSASPYPLHAAIATATVTVSAPPVALLTKLRFSRDGRFLLARARAKRSGVLRMVAKKGKHRLGSCHKRVRSRHRFTCKIKLRKGKSPARAKVSTSLRASGKTTIGKTYRVPRHVPRARKTGH
jgi:Lysyl oxidase